MLIFTVSVAIRWVCCIKCRILSIPSNPREYVFVCVCAHLPWVYLNVCMLVMSSKSWWGKIMPKEGMGWILSWVFLSFAIIILLAKILKTWKMQNLHKLNEPVHLDMHLPAGLYYYRHIVEKKKKKTSEIHHLMGLDIIIKLWQGIYSILFFFFGFCLFQSGVD